MDSQQYLIAHTCPLLTDSLEKRLANDTRHCCTGKFTDYPSLISALPQPEVHAVLLDREFLADNLAEAIGKIQERQPELRIIIFSFHDATYPNCQVLIECGILAVLGTDATTAEFEAAISKEGYHFNQWLTPQNLHAVMRDRKRQFPDKPLFTAREKEILLMICMEKTTREIADACCLSERTIEGVRRVLLEKTNSRSTAGLVAFAFRNKLYS